MAPKNGKNKDRSRSQSKPSTRAHQTANPHSPDTDSSVPAIRSRSHSKKLPPNTDNNNLPESVSSSLSSSHSNQAILDNMCKSSSSDETSNLHPDYDSVGKNHCISNVHVTPGVSDNTGKLATLSPLPTIHNTAIGTEELVGKGLNGDTPPAPPDPLQFIYNELREMRAGIVKIAKLDSIEATTSNFSKQLQTMVDRTEALETSVSTNTTKISSLEQEIKVLKEVVSKQGKIISSVQAIKEDSIKATNEIKVLQEIIHKQGKIISSVQTVKEDFTKTSKEVIDNMNDLVETQREQVETFNESARKLKAETISEADRKVAELSKSIDYKSLQDKASRNRNNLIILGLKEHATSSTYSVVKAFFKNTLKLSRLSVDVAYRLGSPPPEGSDYIRPILVTFPFIADRNAVWKRRNDVSKKDKDRIRIQADLPKQLREDIQLLYRVARAASKIPQYRSAIVREYALVLNGNEYSAQKLETLPQPLRPSSLAIAKSDETLAFFSKHCELSNHYPSLFTLNGNTFHNVEQYLAFKRAEMSDDLSMVERALHTSDPVSAKSILNLLHHDHEREWNMQREGIAMEGLRAKFGQNKRLQSFLLGTGNLQLGEASQNKCWGVGLNLEDPNILDTTKWLDSGNLLGKLLMNVRRELSSSQTSTQD